MRWTKTVLKGLAFAVGALSLVGCRSAGTGVKTGASACAESSTVSAVAPDRLSEVSSDHAPAEVQPNDAMPMAYSFEQRLALRWAPVHYQDVDQTGSQALGGKSDYITAIDFDGDWLGDNNWENIANRGAVAHGYYSVVETDTHWFIVYGFFHPRDWINDLELGGFHENDFEGLLTVVQKPQPGSDEFGECKAIITVAHSDFYSYKSANCEWADGREDFENPRLQLEVADGVEHPRTIQEARGHGLKAVGHNYRTDSDSIRYIPSLDVGEAPSDPNDQNVRYKLVDIFGPDGPWKHRNDAGFLASPGTMRGDNGGANKAHMPWRWDDHNDGPDLPGGELATDPAGLVAKYHSNLGQFSRVYISNRYRE